MSFRVACLTGSRFIRNGTVYSRQGQNTIKNKISGCRYQTTVVIPSLLLNGHLYSTGFASWGFVMLMGEAYILIKEKAKQIEDSMFDELKKKFKLPIKKPPPTEKPQEKVRKPA